MKKLVFVVFLAILGLGTVNAQQGTLNGGFNIGLPTGDTSNVSSFTVGGELNYMFPIASGFTLGPSVQYTHYFGKEIAGNSVDSSFLPISAAARFNVSEKFVLGANLGYAVGLSPSGNDGGFYYRPVVGYKIGKTSQLNLSFSGISKNGGTVSSVNLGVMFGI